ncbi:MAG: phosphotransferase family protein [Streptosporangiaceae bacterium]
MSERDVTSDDEPVNQEVRQPALGKGGREVILSVIDDATSIGEVERLAGGRSSRTPERILVTTRSGTQSVVLKRFPADRDGAAAEWRALTAVEHFPVPSPPPLFLDHDGACFGDPAIVMGALPGTVLHEVPRSVTWLRRATAAMARLHAIPLGKVPAEIPTWPRLLDRWTPDGLPPALGKAAAELRHRARVARRAFCHGDFYLGNLLFAGEVLTGIVDWERAKVMPAGNEVARFRMDLAIHPGGDAPGVFLNAYLKETAAPAVEDLALWDVLAGAVGLAGAARSRQGLEEIGVSPDTVTVARRATSFLENALARC